MDFSSMFDACLAETSARSTPVAPSGPVIVSENHDASSINWMEALGGDPGEIIACGAYQELRKLAGESKEQYFARLPAVLAAMPENHRKIVVDAAMKAAQKRFGIVTDHNGKIPLMVVGKAAWSGLGVNIAEATDSANAIVLSGANWGVKKEQAVRLNKKTGAMEDIAGLFHVIREDDETVLAESVGKIYKPFQNADSFRFLDSVMAEFGAKFHTAGVLFGGRTVFMQVELPAQSFAVNGKDKVDTFATFTNSHDGKSAARCFTTSQRIECANTFRIAMAREKGKGMTIRHTGNLSQRVADAQAALGVAVRSLDTFHASAEAMAATKCEPVGYFNGILDTVCKVTAAGKLFDADPLASVVDAAEAEHAAREFDKRRNLLTELLERYESETNGVNGMRGSVWSAFNAATESANFGGAGGFYRGEDKASSRYESITTGKADEFMQTAYANATALVG